MIDMVDRARKLEDDGVGQSDATIDSASMEESICEQEKER